VPYIQKTELWQLYDTATLYPYPLTHHVKVSAMLYVLFTKYSKRTHHGKTVAPKFPANLIFIRVGNLKSNLVIFIPNQSFVQEFNM